MLPSRHHQQLFLSPQPRFALKKLSVGLVSVLVGLTWLGAAPLVHADSTTPTATGSTTAPSKTTTPGQATTPSKAIPRVNQGEMLTNPHLTVLPDNVNWTTPRHDPPLTGYPENGDSQGINQLPGAIQYSGIQQVGAPGFQEAPATNNQAFGYTIAGNVGISKTGQALVAGTGPSGIVNNHANQQNIIWLGRVNPGSSPSFTAASFIRNADQLPAGTKFDLTSGWFTPNPRAAQFYDPAKEGAAGAVYFAPFSSTGWHVSPVMIKVTYPDDSFSYVSSKYAVISVWNTGVYQNVMAKPGQKLVITPAWVSNGNVGGLDQIKVAVYNADDPQINVMTTTSATSATPLATFVSNSTTGQQSFDFTVPAGVTNLRVAFLPADPTANHTGLVNNPNVLVTGFLGATVMEAVKQELPKPVETTPDQVPSQNPQGQPAKTTPQAKSTMTPMTPAKMAAPAMVPAPMMPTAKTTPMAKAPTKMMPMAKAQPKAQQLPRTGDQHSATALAGLGLLGIALGLFGLEKKRA